MDPQTSNRVLLCTWQTMAEMSRCFLETQCRYYITPKSFLELISFFKYLLRNKQRKWKKRKWQRASLLKKCLFNKLMPRSKRRWLKSRPQRQMKSQKRPWWRGRSQKGTERGQTSIEASCCKWLPQQGNAYGTEKSRQTARWSPYWKRIQPQAANMEPHLTNVVNIDGSKGSYLV